MLAMAQEAGVTDMETVRAVYQDIKEGCDLKVGEINKISFNESFFLAAK